MVDSSSFFWLGLVGSLFLGLFLTVFRTRNARLAAHHAPSPRVPAVAPELWEVGIAPEAAKGAGEQIARKWGDLLPLTARALPQTDTRISESRPPTRRPTQRFNLFRRLSEPVPNPDPEAGPASSKPVDTQVAMLLLMPHPRHSAYHDTQNNVPSNLLPSCEYAIGTVPVSYFDTDLDD